MADQHTKNLRKLLDFLEAQIIHKPENRWFVEELREMLPNRPTQPSEDYSKIERYLGLDFHIDTSKVQLDYSGIQNEYVRNCFEADCREMLRYRFGLRGHKVEFGEFCRFAQIQAERLLNLYYESLGDLAEIKDHIVRFNPSARLNPAQTLESINYAVKLWAYCGEFKLKPVFDVLDKVRKVRNIQSHGAAAETEEALFEKHYSMLLRNGYPLMADCKVDWKALEKQNPSLHNLYVNTIKNTTEHKRYIEMAWQRQQPFDEVTMALDILRMHVLRQLKK